MTIRMKIKNEDSRETAIVAAWTESTGDKPVQNTIVKLKGGEETELYVWSGQRIVVEEVQNG